MTDFFLSPTKLIVHKVEKYNYENSWSLYQGVKFIPIPCKSTLFFHVVH